MKLLLVKSWLNNAANKSTLTMLINANHYSQLKSVDLVDPYSIQFFFKYKGKFLVSCALHIMNFFQIDKNNSYCK